MVLSCMGFCCGCGCGTAFSRTVIGWFAFHCVLGHCTIDPSKFNEYQRRNWVLQRATSRGVAGQLHLNGAPVMQVSL